MNIHTGALSQNTRNPIDMSPTQYPTAKLPAPMPVNRAKMLAERMRLVAARLDQATGTDLDNIEVMLSMLPDELHGQR